MHGFIENGMSDDKFYRYPDMNKILATCRLDPTKDEYKLCIDKFPYLLEQYLKHGHVEDTVYEELGFPMDRDVDGKTIRRDATIAMEARQRAKVLTHEHQIELREERTAIQLAELKRKNDNKVDKCMNTLSDNKICEQKMCTLMGKDYDITHLNDVPHNIISKCTAPLLKAFILCRKIDLPISKLGKKDDLVKKAYEYRSLPNLLQASVDQMNDIITKEEVVEEVIETNDEVLRLGVEIERVNASFYLRDNEWVHRVKTLFDPHSKLVTNEVTDDMMKRADTLQQILLFRMTYHLKRRIEDKAKHNHWSMLWSKRNMAQVASIMVMLGHIKLDLECMRDITSTLLTNPDKYLPAEGYEKDLQGAYLYYDSNDSKWIRSGKVTRRGFAVRHSEHAKKAACRRTTSSFYSRYPTKSNQFSTCRKGYFENLLQYVAVGFSVNDVIEKEVAKTYDVGGIFDCTHEEDEYIKRNQRCNIIDMIAYQIELAYDLAISPSDNISNNPGFESFIGVW